MANPRQHRNVTFSLSLGAVTAALAIAFLLIVVATQPAQAQTFNVLHNFTGGEDGANPYAGREGGGNPYAGVTFDRSGNLYGATTSRYCRRCRFRAVAFGRQLDV